MIAHVDNRITYNGNGNATEFAYQFKILDRTDIKVLLTDADGKEKLLTKDYYVDVEKSVVRYPGYAVGAEVPESERPAVLPTGWKLTIYREVPVTQETDLPDQYPFNQVEAIGDKLTMIAQQLTDTTGRSLKIGVSMSTDIDTTIPWENGKSFRISNDGKTLELSEDPAKVLPLAQGVYTQTQAQAQSAAASARLAEDYKNAAETAKNAASLYATNAKNSAGEAKTYMDNAKRYSENVNVFTPSVSSDGVLSWTNKAGLPNPASVNIKGAKGDQGLQGATGTAATITIGSVTTGEPGTNVVVSNSGTSTNAILNFQIPRGTPGADGGVTVDEALSDTSFNPVANRVIKAALDKKANKDGVILRATGDSAGNNIIQTYATKTELTNGLDTKLGINDTAVKATYLALHKSSVNIDRFIPFQSDGLYENRLDAVYANTFKYNPATDNLTVGTINGVNVNNLVKTVNGTAPDATGNVTIEVSGGVSTTSENTWTGQQTFNKAILKDTMLVKALIKQEVYQSEYINGTTITPTRSTMRLIATGATTLDMTTIVANFLSVTHASTVFTAYITSDADYTLTITNAGTIKYIGSASDVAITSAGLLLNILLMNDASGNVASIVQASKLEGGA